MKGYFSRSATGSQTTLVILGVCVSKQKCADPKRDDSKPNFMDRVGVSDLKLSTQPFTGVESKPLREMKYREWWKPKSHVN